MAGNPDDDRSSPRSQSDLILSVEDTIPDQSPVGHSSSAMSLVHDNFSSESEATLRKNYYSLSYPTPIFDEDVNSRSLKNEKKFEYTAFLCFGLGQFMSYAAHFCKYEARNGAAEIVSVGSGDGAVDREIVATYQKYFGQEIRITLIDPTPEYGADFKTVDDLIEERPNVVRNCVAFIIWPEPLGWNDAYDIEAIRKLQPLAVLTVYEPTGISGSEEFVAFLNREIKKELGDEYCDPHPSSDDTDECYDPGHKFDLDNYKVEEVVRQEVYLPAGGEVEVIDGLKVRIQPGLCSHRMRMVRLKRTD